ncbi:FecR family protein [Chitinophaga sp.]|uniref:FecR family protein n=1 Tax=Chitinophaga sp. TaxID=1869181 RepID=UPI002F932FAA
MSKTRFQVLFERFLAGSCTPAEKQELAALILSKEQEQTISGLLEDAWAETDGNTDMDKAKVDRLFESILAEPAPRRVYFLRKWWLAASILFLLATGIGLWLTSPVQTRISHQQQDITPGKNGAILTLADGTQVALDTFKNATVALQGGVTAKVVNGSLVYEGSGDVMVYNTMSTPKGRQFMLTLPDGTQVWLNAASSIRYPVFFAGKDRSVTITGEAYFEVAKNKAMPFRVNIADKAAVEVLGTHFNVNAYDNERSINTTLMEGLVRVSADKAAAPVVLKPGEQAELNGTIKINKNVDVERIMAWKNGFINFEGATFEEIMRQLERWYNIEVVYENNKTPDVQLAGGMSRGVSLNDLLKQLGEMGVHYKLNDRTLIILP